MMVTCVAGVAVARIALATSTMPAKFAWWPCGRASYLPCGSQIVLGDLAVSGVNLVGYNRPPVFVFYSHPVIMMTRLFMPRGISPNLWQPINGPN